MPGIFISYRREDSAAVAGRLYDRLSQRFGGTRVFRDVDAIEAGDEFAKVIVERIGTCNALIALIGKKWLDARDAEGHRRLDQPCDFVAVEISEALARQKLVIPVLLEGASMPAREALPPHMASFADRHALPISDSRFDYDVGLLIGSIEKVIPSLPPPPLPPGAGGSGLTARDLRNRRDLLKDVKGEVADRLAQSLHSAMLINLPKEKQPQQVRRPWDVEVKLSHQPSTALPPGTEIIDVFDQDAIAGKLLVLGAPGAGKTMTLLQLAKELTARAETDAGAPMPVLLNLSSWKDDNKSLAPWLQAELKLKYGVRKDIGQRWIEERCLLPLLDGLNELEPTRQDKCVRAINQFQQEYRPEHLVVCCRLAEYQNSETKLQLNGAIYLQPLTNEQIRKYLVIATFPELWSSIQADAELLDLARTPLLLSMITLAHEARSIQDRPTFHLPRERQYLFDWYIERMLSRETKSKQYTKDNTLHWLTWLAKSLRDQAQTEFLIEKLQPSWLRSLAHKWLYRIFVVLIIAVAFGIFDWFHDSLVAHLIPEGQLEFALRDAVQQKLGGDVPQFFPVLGNMSFALIVGLILGLMQTIRPIETVQWSGTRAWSEMVHGSRRWAIAGLKFGAYVGLVAGLFDYPLFIVSPTIGSIAGSLVAAAVVVLLIARTRIWLIARNRERLALRSPDALISALICGLSFWLISGMLIGILAGLSIGTIAGLSHAMSGRTAYRVVGALVVALVAWLISSVIIGLTGALVLKVEMRLSDVNLWLCGWVGGGATAGLLVGLIAGLRKKAEALQTRPGIESWNWRALRWRQWLIAGVVAASIAIPIVILLMAFGQTRAIRAVWLSFGFGSVLTLSMSLLIGLGVSACGGVVGALLGALFGMLRGGLTGPDIERRTAPNQGVRRSAINVGAFALIGGLTLGTFVGLLNLSCAVLLTGLVPEAADWLRCELSHVLLFGFLSGLVPGAACIQHFALRFILWCRGVAPWNYAYFLNYATERMLLQRGGGRYWFIHELLREHFAAMGPKRVESLSGTKC